MENVGKSANGKDDGRQHVELGAGTKSRFSAAEKTADDILQFLSKGAQTRHGIGERTSPQFDCIQQTPDATCFTTPHERYVWNSRNSPIDKTVPISPNDSVKQQVQISVAGASIRTQASLSKVPSTGEPPSRQYSFKHVTMKHPQSRNVIYVSPKLNCANNPSNLTEQNTSVGGNQSQNLSSRTLATGELSGQQPFNSSSNKECASNCQGAVQVKGQSLLADRPRKIISLSVGASQKQNLIHRSTISLLSLIKNGGNRLIVERPLQFEEQTRKGEKKDARLRQLSNPSLIRGPSPTKIPTDQEVPLQRKSSEKLTKLKTATNRAEFLPSIPNADDIQRHLQATISLTAFKPFSDGSNSSFRNRTNGVASNVPGGEIITEEPPSLEEEVDSDGIFEEETTLVLDDPTASECRPKPEKDEYINNCYLMYAINVLARKWEEYITFDRQTLYDLECQSARDNYSKEAADMIADRGRYVWQLIDEMEPLNFNL